MRDDLVSPVENEDVSDDSQVEFDIRNARKGRSNFQKSYFNEVQRPLSSRVENVDSIASDGYDKIKIIDDNLSFKTKE